MGGVGVTVNAIAPGYMATDNTAARATTATATARSSPASPPDGWGTPGDLGGAVVFLASDAPAYVTGRPARRRRLAGPLRSLERKLMEQRYATNPAQVPGWTTEELRAQYLVPEIFVPGEIRLTYTHHDRVVLAGVVPPRGARCPADVPGDPLATTFFEHREAGIVNVGAAGTVTVDGQVHKLDHTGCVYVGRGVAKDRLRGRERPRVLLPVLRAGAHRVPDDPGRAG